MENCAVSLAPYVSPDVCLPNTAKNNQMPYVQGFTAVVVLLVQAVRVLLLLLLLTVAFVLWIWGISFQTGRLYRRWIKIEEPTPWQIIYKLGEIATFPLVVIGRWSRQKVKELLQIDLPQLPSTPPASCKELLPPIEET